MALIPFDNFVGPAYRSQSKYADCELTMNFYPETIQSRGARSQMMLAPTPGVVATSYSASAAPCRAMYQQDGRAFVILGFQLLELSPNGAMTLIGNVLMDDKPAYMCTSGDGGKSLLAVSAGNVYKADLTTSPASSFAQVTMPNAALGHFCGFLSGRFLVLDASTSTVWISDIYSANFNALNFRQRSLASDRWVSMVVTRSAIWLLGSQTYEVWGVSGNFPIPFDPITGALFPVGCFAPHSARAIGDSVAWLSGDNDGIGEVKLSQQYSATSINDYAVAYKIQSAVENGMDLSDGVGMVYQEIGHDFYLLTFRNADFTIGYDLGMGLWHSRGFWDVNNAIYRAWRPMYHMTAFGKHLVGDRSSGTIYTLAANQFIDVGGALIRRVRRCPHLESNQSNIFYNELRLGVQKGVGNPDTAPDPSIMLRYSDDGGETFGNGLVASIGPQGRYGIDVWFNQLGMARDRVFEVIMSDPAPYYITGAFLDYTLGTF